MRNAIEESTDGWETVSTVWEIEASASWWVHKEVDGPGFTAGVFDIVVAGDQTVGVAAGQIGVITRDADGEWSPSVAYLRTLPVAPRLLVLASALVILTGVGLAHGPYWSARRKARWGYRLAIPLLLVSSSWVAFGAGFTAEVLSFLTGFLAIGGALVLAFARSEQSPAYGQHDGAVFASFCASLVAALGLLYVLWSRAIIGWNFTIWSSVVVLAMALVGLPVVLRALSTTPPPPRERIQILTKIEDVN